MPSHPLYNELALHNHFQRRLKHDFPDADEDTLRDTLDGITNLNEKLSAVIRSHLEDRSLIGALKARVNEMQERLKRLEYRAEKKRALVTEVMQRAELKKLTDAEFTASLRPSRPRLVVTDEEAIPPKFWNPQPAKLDRMSLLRELETKGPVPGAVLSNASATISVRTK